jgi:hypothetical protein
MWTQTDKGDVTAGKSVPGGLLDLSVKIGELGMRHFHFNAATPANDMMVIATGYLVNQFATAIPYVGRQRKTILHKKFQCAINGCLGKPGHALAGLLKHIGRR